MMKKVSRWVLHVKKSYVNFRFVFDTAEGASDFFEMFTAAFAPEAKDTDEVKFEIYAELENEEEE